MQGIREEQGRGTAMGAPRGRDEPQDGRGGTVCRRASELKGTEANSRMRLGGLIKNPGRMKLAEDPSGSSWGNRNHFNDKHSLWRTG